MTQTIPILGTVSADEPAPARPGEAPVFIVLAIAGEPPFDNLDKLDGLKVEFSIAGVTALALASYRKRLAAQNGGTLNPHDRAKLIRRCKRLGFNRIWTKFVLGAQ